MSDHKAEQEDDILTVKTFAKKRLPSDEVDALKTKFHKANKYSLEQTKTRNILMVGRTRSGKSTAIGVLKDPCYEPKDMSIFSDTFDPDFRSFSLDDKDKKMKYTLNIIDTPGLKETKALSSEVKKRDDEEIIGTINYCLKNEVTKINNLLIFISFELGVSGDDVDSFQNFLERFSHPDINVIVCITRSEDKTDEWKDRMLKQLSEHEYFSKVLARTNIRTCFLGCVDSEKNNILSSIDDLQGLYARVYQMRKELLLAIFNSETQVKLVDLPIAERSIAEVKDIFKCQNELLAHLRNINDYGLDTARLKVDEFATITKKLAAYTGILLEPQFHAEWEAVRKQMVEIILLGHMPEDVKKKFVGTVALNLPKNKQ